jgi:hypothetical protein
MPPISIARNGSLPVVIGNVLAAAASESRHSVHTCEPMSMYCGSRLSMRFSKVAALVDADEVWHVVAHRADRVMGIVIEPRPIAWSVGQPFHHCRRADRHVDGVHRPLRSFRDPAAIRRVCTIW